MRYKKEKLREQEMKTTCYVCGQIVQSAYYEILHKESGVRDRVFLCCYDCVERIEDKYYFKRAVIRD